MFRYIFNGCSETSQASFGVTPSVQVQPQPCPPLPCLLSLFLSLPVFARIFLFPTHLLRGHIIYVNLQPPSHTVLLLYQTPGSIYGGTPVPGRREAKYPKILRHTQFHHSFSFPPGPRCPVFSNSPDTTLLGNLLLWSPMRSSAPNHNNLHVRTVLLRNSHRSGASLQERTWSFDDWHQTPNIGFEAIPCTR